MKRKEASEMKKIFLFGFSIVILFSLSIKAFSADRDVCPTCTYTTIQSAINVAASGDRIRVGSGIYHENLNSNSSAFTLSGGWSNNFSTQIKNPSLTVIDGDNSTRTLSVSGPSDITIENITFQNGNTHGFGGCILMNSSNGQINFVLQNAVVQDCETVAVGGGISFLVYNNPLKANLENVIVRRNHAHSAGGGISVVTDTISTPGEAVVDIVNSMIYLNTAGREAGGIQVWAEEKGYTRVVILNSTITGNSSNNTYEGGGGIVVNGDTDPDSTSILEMYNTLLYGNTANPGADLTINLYGVQSRAEVHYSNVNDINDMRGTFNQSNNLNAAPLFVDPSNNDYRLQPTSPMIDAGTAAVPDPPGLPVTDMDGNPRIIGPAPDIGAYEFSPVNPPQGTYGTKMTISGSGFGERKGKVVVGGASLKILDWTGSSIQGQLTRALSPDTYDVIIRPQAKGATPITIPNGFAVKVPEIDSVEPTSGPVGGQITINGFFFGTKKGKVTLSGKSCKVLSWEMDETTGDSKIRFFVPKGLTPGVNELIVVTTGVGSVTANFNVD